MYLLVPEGRAATVLINDGHMFANKQQIVNHLFSLFSLNNQMTEMDLHVYQQSAIPADHLLTPLVFRRNRWRPTRFRVYINQHPSGLGQIHLRNDPDWETLARAGARNELERRVAQNGATN
jgi:hypothetical protein